MQISWRKAMLGGLAATLAMTAVGVWAAPMMGMPAMNPAAMLATKMSNSMVMGWADGAPARGTI